MTRAAGVRGVVLGVLRALGVSCSSRGIGGSSVRAVVVACVGFGLVGLAVPGVSSASKGVDRFFPLEAGPGTAGGVFNGPADVAVNQSSSADAHDGWVYVVDTGNHRVQAFDASEQFQWAVGNDVVEPGGVGNGADNEVQTVTVAGASGGTFTLEFGGGSGGTPAIAFNASAGTVENALEQSSGIGVGNVSVTSANPGGGSGPGGPYTVEFVGALADRDVSQLAGRAGPATNSDTGVSYGLTPAGASVSVATVEPGASVELCSVAADCKAGVQGAGAGMFNAPEGIAIDQVSGDLYVRDGANARVQQFTADGAFVRAWGWDVIANGSASDPGNVTGFQVCETAADCKAGTSGGGPGQLSSAESVGGAIAVAPAGSPTAGHVFVGDPGGGFSLGKRVLEFGAQGGFVRAWGWNVAPTATPGDTGSGFEICTTACQSPPNNSGGSFNQPGAFANTNPAHIAVDGDGIVYASDNRGGPPAINSRIQRFDSSAAAAADLLLAPIALEAGGGPLLDASTAAMKVARVDPDGGGPLLPVDRLLVARGDIGVQELTTGPGAITSVDTHMEGAGLTARGLDLDAATGDLYVSSSSGSPAAHRVYVLDDDGAGGALAATLDPPTSLGAHSASFTGTVDPGGFPTTARFEVSKDGVSWTAVGADQDIGSASGPVAIAANATALEANTFYRVRIGATRGYGAGTARSAELTFSTLTAAPEVSTDGARVTAIGAYVDGTINPNGQATSYRFEYGETTAYGSTVPTPDASAGSAATAVSVTAPIGGLAPDTTYHYRLVATNADGTTAGADRTFTTHKATTAGPARGYELVSPPYKIAGVGAGTPAPGADGPEQAGGGWVGCPCR
jgi:hypothetical protein